MSKKIINLALAATMLSQTTAYASRTDGIARESISQAQMNIRSVNDQLLDLDRALEQAAIQISQGQGNAANWTTTLLSTALTTGVILYTSLAKAPESYLISVIQSVVSSSVALTSGGLTVGSIVLSEEREELEQFRYALIQAETELNNSSQMSNAHSAVMLNLKEQVTTTLAHLTDYMATKSQKSKELATSSAMQFIGGGITLAASFKEVKAVVAIGHTISSVGNLFKLLSLFTSEQTDEILAEINKTRGTLAAARSTLELPME